MWVFELQMWMLTEGSVHELQDCRDGGSPIASGTARVVFLYPIYTVRLVELKRWWWWSVSLFCTG